MPGMQKILIITGVAIVVAGLLWPWFGKVPLGRLPEDIISSRPGMKIFFPITSMVVVSVLVSLTLWVLKK